MDVLRDWGRDFIAQDVNKGGLLLPNIDEVPNSWVLRFLLESVDLLLELYPCQVYIAVCKLVSYTHASALTPLQSSSQSLALALVLSCTQRSGARRRSGLRASSS